MIAILIHAEKLLHNGEERLRGEVIHVEEDVARWLVHHGLGSNVEADHPNPNA